MHTHIGEAQSRELNFMDFITGINSEKYVLIHGQVNVRKLFLL